MDRSQALVRVAELRQELTRHNYLYYVAAAPEISDRQYDALYRELVELEEAFPGLVTADSPTQRVGGEPLDAFRTCPHAVPMLSLDNTYNADDLRKFDKHICEKLGVEAVTYLVEPKVDGVSISVRYEDGRLVQALTRGSGAEGDDVTANVRTIRSVPLRLRAEPPPLVWEARGEVFMPKHAFAKLNARRRDLGETPFANARNATAGTLKLLDPRIVAQRPLDVVFYANGETRGIEICDQESLLQSLRDFGFPVQSFAVAARGLDALLEAVNALERQRHQFPYDIDGAVIKVNDFSQRERLGFTAKAPSWAKAFKYAAEQRTTRLLDITVQVGRTGTLTPVAELEPVALAGSTISRATLHNEDEIRRKDIRIGDAVVIEKAGDVIPAVVAVVPEERPPGTAPFDLCSHVGGRCPSCGSPIRRDPQFVAWRCENLQCPAQSVRRIEHFAARSAMDIEALGDIVAERLVEAGLVREPLDLFDLDPDRLAALNLGTAEEPRVFGAKNAAKLGEALERARALPLERWLHALGIPNTGVATARQIAALHEDIEAVAESPVLRDVVALAAKQEESRDLNPNSTRNRPASDREREERARKFAECNAEIAALGERLRALDLVRASGKKAGKAPKPPQFVTTQFGPVTARSVLDYFASWTGKEVLARLRELGIRPRRAARGAEAPSLPPTFANLTVVLTGSLGSMTREQAAAEVRQRGGNAISSVSSKTDLLVAGADPSARKVADAKRLGIEILNEQQFLERVAAPSAAGSATGSLFAWAETEQRE